MPEPCGGSTGTNLWACARLIYQMAAREESGSVVSILCDQGERYASTYFNDAWVARRNLDLGPGMAAMRDFFAGKLAGLHLKLVLRGPL